MSVGFTINEAFRYEGATTYGWASGAFDPSANPVDGSALAPTDLAYLREVAVPLGLASEADAPDAVPVPPPADAPSAPSAPPVPDTVPAVAGVSGDGA
ncbi:hypothetical protein GCM10009760_25930 [Kitasatospora kazusensis]|uniref:Uncharacterized protein n=1 Tax=Kitasatospora kazusensis TaxID=407974 RepID=A0ABP5L8I2_9ACTN